MRLSFLCVVLATSLSMPAIAAAKDQRDQPAKPANAKPAKAEPANAKPANGTPATARPAKPRPAAADSKRPDLSRAARDAASRAPVAPRPSLDLTPSKVLGPGLLTGDRRGAERHPGLVLEDDSWRAHAVQAGAMAFGFVALSALCSGGACMLPDGLTDWIPGVDGDDPFGSAAEIRPRQSLPQAR